MQSFPGRPRRQVDVPRRGQQKHLPPPKRLSKREERKLLEARRALVEALNRALVI